MESGDSFLFRIRKACRTIAAVVIAFGLCFSQSIAAPQEEWFQILFDDAPVGYERIRTRNIDADSPRHRIIRSRETRLTLVRFGRNLSVSADLETTETPDGSLLEWSLNRTAGDGTTMERTGVWNAEHRSYEIDEKIQGTRRERSIKCEAPAKSPVLSVWLPPFALAEKKRRFTIDVMFPESAAVSEVQVQMSGPETLRTPAGKNVSTEGIQFWPRANPDQKTELFADQSGQVIRSEQTLIGSRLVLVRTDAATAIGSGTRDGLQMDLSAVIPVQQGISNPQTRRTTRLRITVPAGQQLSIPEGDFQKVETISLSEVFVTLSSPVNFEANSSLKNDNNSVSGVSRRTPVVAPEFTASTILINSSDQLVGRHARLSAGTVAEPAESCRRMAHYLHSNLKPSPFSTSCQSSAAVAKSMRGDCTEHAVLLAAMMRNIGIPSRVVIGLTYSDQTSAMIGHMWAEAWIDGRWIPYDSTRRTGHPGATSLKLADSSLPDDVGDGVLLFLPLLDLFGKAKISVVADEPK